MPNHQGTYKHTVEIPVRWSDMDALGHVNSSVFFTYLEQARIEWWREYLPSLMQQETGPVIVNASCTFLKPILYPEILLIKIFAGKPGRSSYECFYEVYSKQEPAILYAEGATKIVWVDRKTGRSTPLPDSLLALLPQQ